MADTSQHMYHKFFVVLGRKPEALTSDALTSEGSSDRTVIRPPSKAGPEEEGTRI